MIWKIIKDMWKLWIKVYKILTCVLNELKVIIWERKGENEIENKIERGRMKISRKSIESVKVYKWKGEYLDFSTNRQLLRLCSKSKWSTQYIWTQSKLIGFAIIKKGEIVDLKVILMITKLDLMITNPNSIWMIDSDDYKS